MTKLNLDQIRIDGDTQARIALDSAQVASYAECLREGDKFPPVVVFHDGSHYWLADGFHRYHAHRQAELPDIEVEVAPGTVDEAQIYSFGANSKRGLSTTHEDNRAIIKRMFEHPISKGWTNAQIARHVGVSKMTVGRIKASLGITSPTKRTYTKKDGQKVTINTEKLSTKQPQEDTSADMAAEMAGTVELLSAENQRLKDAIAVGQWDASDIEKIDAQETINELREQIRLLEIDNRALRDSRDMFQNRNAELMQLVKSLQSKLKKLDK
jgi:hypothetical protein